MVRQWVTIIEPFRIHSVEPDPASALYTQSHVDYVIEVCEYVAERAGELRGLEIVEQPPALRHFTARFSPLKS